MIYVLSNNFEVAKLKKKILQLIDKGAKVEVTEVKKRTLKQNDFLHLLIKIWAIESGEPDFIEAKKIVKAAVGPTYEKSGLPRPTSTLSKDEMRLMIDRLYNWAGLQGIVLPTTEQAPEAIDYVERNRF